MQYVEILRAKRILTWYAIVVAGVTAIVAVSVLAQPHASQGAGPIPLADVFLLCTVGAFVLATIMSTSLASESTTLAISWTRPVSRERIAWSFIAVDVAAILLGYALLVAAALLCIALIGLSGYLYGGPSSWGGFVLGAGSAVMWYALGLVASSRLAAHGVRVATFTWLAFIVVNAVWAAPVPAPIHAVLTALNYLDPIAYINGVGTGGHAHPAQAHPLPPAQTTRIALEWIIAAVALVAAVRIWSTREA